MKLRKSIWNFKRLKITISAILITCLVPIITSCSLIKRDSVYTNVVPQQEQLNANLLEAMQPNSTEVLLKADKWLKSSEELLSKEITKLDN